MSLRDELQTIYDQHGRLTPDLVAQIARPKKHPLHRHVFDRPVKEAAEAYYRDRAHELIRSVRIVYREADENGPEKSIRAFHAVQSAPNQYVYEPADLVAGDEFARQIVLRNMEREWKTLFRRYSDFEEFVALVVEDVGQKAA